jgi:hypothetical protein
MRYVVVAVLFLLSASAFSGEVSSANKKHVVARVAPGTKILQNRDYVITLLPLEFEGGYLIQRNAREDDSAWLDFSELTATADSTVYMVVRGTVQAQGWEKAAIVFETSCPKGEEWKWSVYSRAFSQSIKSPQIQSPGTLLYFIKPKPLSIEDVVSLMKELYHFIKDNKLAEHDKRKRQIIKELKGQVLCGTLNEKEVFGDKQISISWGERFHLAKKLKLLININQPISIGSKPDDIEEFSGTIKRVNINVSDISDASIYIELDGEN